MGLNKTEDREANTWGRLRGIDDLEVSMRSKNW